MKRYLIIYEGKVQGVGFRYFVYRAAYTKNLTGSVRNMMNGNVEIEVQGDEEVIKAFLDTVKKGNGFSEITNHAIKEIPVKEREKKFDIAY